MKLIVTQLVRLLAALVLSAGVVLAASLVLVPRAAVGPRLDTARAGASLYLTEPKYVFLARGVLNSQADKVLLLGASNMLAGFPQPQVQALVNGLEVHNLSFGGSNLTQLSQIVELVRQVQAPEARRHNTYVIGLWYGLFADDRARWYTPDRSPGDTDIDIERYRYGFYLRTDRGPQALLPPQRLDLGLVLIHPWLLLDRCARDLHRGLRSFLAAPAPTMTEAQRDAVVVSAAQKLKSLQFWAGYMGHAATLEDSSFRTLEMMIDSILAEGGRVVLVDLPLPRWHAQASVLAADYRQKTQALWQRQRLRAGVAVLHMDDADNDDEFSDEVHPKPRVTRRWAGSLALTLTAGLATQPVRAASAR